MKPIVEEYESLNMKYKELKEKYYRNSKDLNSREKYDYEEESNFRSYTNSRNERRNDKERKRSSQMNDKSRKFNHYSEASMSANRNSNPVRKTSTILHYGFLSSCYFITLPNKEFIYGCIHRLSRGVLRSERIYSSR